MSIIVIGFVVFNLGFMVGCFFFAVSTWNNSHDIWEIRNREGHVYYLTDPYEVDAALRVDGYMEVRRLKVLT